LAIHLGYGDESLKLLKKSAESGDDKALLLLANRYTLGLGVNPSSLTAKNYLDQVQISSLELIEAWHDLKRST
jgi:TPR repeat protein